MNSPFRSNPPDEARPYIPSWGRQQPTHRGSGYDIFSDEENPSYREMAQMFSPQPPPEKERSRGSGKMLLRFLGIVGFAVTALGLFVGYVVTQPRDGTLVAGRDSGGLGNGVTKAIDAVQATFAASLSQPAAEKPAPVSKPAKETPPPAAVSADPAPVAKAAEPPKAVVAPEPAPAPPAVAEPAPAPKPDVPVPAPQVATLTENTGPVPAPAPTIPELTPGELATLMARGRRFVENGDFASARPVYRRAAEAGYAEAAIALGETYDPFTLSQRGAVGIAPNIEEARRWYTRARDMGSLEAPTRLERLSK